MPINHDPNSEDFKIRVQAYIMFFRQIGEKAAAEFCAHQDATIEGLQHNNDTFVKAYREAAEQKDAGDKVRICPVCGGTLIVKPNGALIG